jgi:hypothetical protein
VAQVLLGGAEEVLNARLVVFEDPLKFNDGISGPEVCDVTSCSKVRFFDFGPRLAVGKLNVHAALARLQWLQRSSETS